MPQQQTLAQMVRAKYPDAYNDLSDADLEKAVKTKYPGVYDDLPTTQAGSQSSQAGAGQEKTSTGQSQAPFNPPRFLRAAESLGRGISDLAIGAAKGVGSTALGLSELINKGTAAVGLSKPIDLAVWNQARQDFTTATNTAQSVGKFGEQVAEAFVPGRAVTTAAGRFAAAVPRGTRLLTRAATEGAGQAAIAAAQGNDPTTAGLVGGALSGVGGAVGAVRRGLVNPNQVEREALEYAASRGVPVDAGTMSGNAALKGTKYLADRTLAGSAVASQAANQEAKSLKRLAESLSARAHPNAASPMSAGQDVRDALSQRVTDLHEEANAAYNTLREMEEANVQRVITGTGPSKTGVVRAVTQTESMGFPVQLKPVKEVLRPIYERISRQMPITQQQASYGFKALENIVKGPDLLPASIVDADLSAIKAIARQASRPELRDLSQGLAAGAVAELDNAVRKAVSQGGPKAIAALEQGRKATKAKFLTAEILDSINTEPVKAFRMATERGDASIAKLRELQALAPNEVPKLGRAFLDDAIETATADGGFKGAATLANKWQSLGPETKKILFPQPGLTQELDRFFIAARRLAENPNPSGSGGMVSIGSNLGLLMFDPALGIGTQVGGAVVSKLLRNPTTVRLLTQGMTTKPKSVTGAALKQAVIRALSGKDDQ